MPRRLGFTVVDSSGHEEGYNAVELRSHGPTVQGWRSPRYSLYPQEIVLCLEGPCHVQKLQVLSHQFLISSKLEIYIGESQHQGSAYTRLGYVALSDNEKTGFRARELKSVHVDATGRYLKFLIHKNHINKYNTHNQVGLVAINILGDAVDDTDSGNYSPGAADRLISQYLKQHPDDPALSSTAQRKEEFDPLDDLAFGMYVDPEVAGMIRTLDARKRAAVREEKFNVAKTLKQAIADLHKVGERLGRYEVEKRCAVEQEDFDLAEKKKQQMEEYRQRVYQELRLHNLLQEEEVEWLSSPLFDYEGHGTEMGSHRGLRSSNPHSTSPAGHTARSKALEERGTPKGMLAAGEDVHTSRSETRSQRMYSTQPTRQNPPSHDDRPIPTVVRQQQHKAQDNAGDKDSLSAQAWVGEDALTPLSAEGGDKAGGEPSAKQEEGEPRGSGTPEPLNEMALREAGQVIDVFGEALVAGAYSKTWSYREDALLAIYRQMAELKEGLAREDIRAMLRAAIFLVRRALRDQVTSVFSASLKVLKMLVTQFVPQHRLGRSDLTHCVEGALQGLMLRTGDTTTRHRNAAMSFIQELALLQAVRALQLVPPALLQPFRAHGATRLVISQLELLLRLLPELGLEGHGLTPTNVMKVAQCGLDHTGADVRETAVRLVLALYGMKREAVRALLPPDDANTRRNLLYRGLFDAMDRMDGIPLQAKMRPKAAAEEAERRKQAEIQVLQQQLSALHEIQAQVQLTKEKEKGRPGKKRAEEPAVTSQRPKPVESPPSAMPQFLENICVFCGERSDSFTDEGLDVHYWRHCPMLQRCDDCEQVVEISGLTAHRLGDCERGDGYGKCPRCAEAVPKAKLSEHVQAKSCAPAKPENVVNRCPLCHTDFPPGEEAWKPHLVNKEGCTKNPRKEQYLQLLQEAQKGGASKSGGAGAKVGQGATKVPTRGGLPRPQPAGRNAAK